MSNFYDKLPIDAATEIERLSRLMYELRENRKALLAQYSVEDHETLLANIADGRVAEHPTYEHYLGVRILTAAHDAVRAQLRAITSGRDEEAITQVLHLTLQGHIASHYADRLQGSVQLAQDALLLRLDNGVTMEMRFADQASYSLNWQWGEAIQRIDTAPVHHDLATFPQHWHDAAGKVHPDPLTDPNRDAWNNARAVIDALLVDPLLGG